jgi:hypothetical protein
MMLAALIIHAAASGCADPQEPTSASRAAVTDPRGRAITSEELARITSQPAYADQQEMFDEQRGTIGLARGLVYTYDGSEVSGTESRFPVTTRDGTALPDLVYQDTDVGGEFFYLIGAAAPAASPGARSDGLFGCGAWTSWTYVGTSCEPHFWCFGHGTYKRYKRTRECRKGTQEANRRDFVSCGC